MLKGDTKNVEPTTPSTPNTPDRSIDTTTTVATASTGSTILPRSTNDSLHHAVEIQEVSKFGDGVHSTPLSFFTMYPQSRPISFLI